MYHQIKAMIWNDELLHQFDREIFILSGRSLWKPPGVVEFYGLDIYESIQPE
ncbi:hypothetical protein A2U01_0106162, partial [Trifolium medium]|nr:hypothetical protein [Trifolium medium]